MFITNLLALCERGKCVNLASRLKHVLKCTKTTTWVSSLIDKVNREFAFYREECAINDTSTPIFQSNFSWHELHEFLKYIYKAGHIPKMICTLYDRCRRLTKLNNSSRCRQICTYHVSFLVYLTVKSPTWTVNDFKS